MRSAVKSAVVMMPANLPAPPAWGSKRMSSSVEVAERATNGAVPAVAEKMFWAEVAKLVPVATPKTGVVKVGLVANTRRPEPVSSSMMAASSLEASISSLLRTAIPDSCKAILLKFKVAKAVELVKVPTLEVSSRFKVKSSSDPFPRPRKVMAPSPSSAKLTPAEPMMIEVVKVGLVAKARRPDPVSSVTAEARLAEDGVAKKVATPVPKPETPVEMGRPVALVKVPELGVPRAGVTRVGEVEKTRLVEVVPVVPVAEER